MKWRQDISNQNTKEQTNTKTKHWVCSYDSWITFDIDVSIFYIYISSKYYSNLCKYELLGNPAPSFIEFIAGSSSC